MDDELKEKLFEAAISILRKEGIGTAHRVVADFLLRLYGRDQPLTAAEVESALSSLVEEALETYEQMTGKRHRLVRGLYVQIDGADEQGPFDRLSVTTDQLVSGKRGHETVLALWRGDRRRWESPGQPGSATGSGFNVVAATDRSDHFEVVAKSGIVIGCCSEAGQAYVLEEEPGVRFRLVEPEVCRNCRDEP